MLKSPSPLSESGVWDLLARFYRERGLDAWTSGKVPQRMTSNGFLADTYAAVIAAFLRDLDRQGGEAPPLILEVGGGSGLSAWLLLNRLLRHHLDAEPPRFDFLLTETDPARVRAWARIPRLRRLMDEGSLHLGVLAIDGAAPPHVTSSDGTRFDLTNRPVVLVANYVMDSLPADLLRVRGGRVQKEFVTIEGESSAGDGRPSLARLTTRFESREIGPPYTGHRGVDEVIDSYRDLPGDPCIPISMVFVSFLEPLLESNAPLLMLAGDLAYTTAEFDPEPPLIHEDYLACTANFHLLSRLFEQRGGSAVFSHHPDPVFSAAAFIQAARATDLPLTREAARVALGYFGPHDMLNVEEALSSHPGPLDFNMLSGWLRLARCDSSVTRLCIPHLMRIIEADGPFDRVALRKILFESFRCELPEATGEASLATQIAVVFVRAGMYQEAADFLGLVLSEGGLSCECLHLKAVAALRLGHLEQVPLLLNEIAAREPDYWNGWPSEPNQLLEVDAGALESAADGAHCDHVILRLSVAAFRRKDPKSSNADASN